MGCRFGCVLIVVSLLFSRVLSILAVLIWSCAEYTSSADYLCVKYALDADARDGAPLRAGILLDH